MKKLHTVPESDLVKLAREHDSLRARLAANAGGLKASEDAVQAASIEYNTICARHEGIQATLLRDFRVLSAQMQNVEELLRNVATGSPTSCSNRLGKTCSAEGSAFFR